MNLRSYIWEKKRQVAAERDALYNRLLLDGFTGETGDEIGDVADYAIPTLSVRQYTIKKGDSLFGIARTFNVTIDTIISTNQISNAFYLPIGGTLIIPDRSGIYHQVSRGETLSGIARRYGVGMNEVADVNDLSTSILQVGQKLFVPGGRMNEWDRAVVLGELFTRPARGIITSRMGFRKDPFTGLRTYHSGVDIAGRRGTNVLASQRGRVVYAGYRGNYGRTVIIAHPLGYRTVYGHLDRIFVKQGQAVRQSQPIGSMGNTGRSTGPHLHFEVHQRGRLIDPLTVVRLR